MSDTTTDTADHLKFIAAMVELAQSDLCGAQPRLDPHSTVIAIEAAICRLDHMRSLLPGVVVALCGDRGGDMQHYADGRLVTSHWRFGDGTQYVFPWDPDRAHDMNKPHEIATVTTRSGRRKAMIVSAPGHLDSLTICEGEQ